jgi:hypothetical protein
MTLMGQSINFELREELATQYLPRANGGEPQQVMVGTGRLKLKLVAYWSWNSGIRITFNDSRAQRLEDSFNELMVSLWHMAHQGQTHAWKTEQGRSEKEVIEQEYQRRQEVIAAERYRRHDLTQRIQHFRNAHAIRSFLERVPVKNDPDHQAWCAWAVRHAERLEQLAFEVYPAHLIALRDSVIERMEVLPEPPARRQGLSISQLRPPSEAVVSAAALKMVSSP